MTEAALLGRFREIAAHDLPLPGKGQTSQRHHRLLEIGRQDLSLARLTEAHFDAVAILAEAGREPEPGALYAVWAAEVPGRSLSLIEVEEGFHVDGSKVFCSGAGLVDRALVTLDAPEPYLADVDLRLRGETLHVDATGWKSPAFAETRTATVTFRNLRLAPQNILGERGWYLSRPGFWQGACGPAACWAGGALGLVDYARLRARNDPHTLAHLGAMHALEWQIRGCLEAAGLEIDGAGGSVHETHMFALSLRHLIEQASTEILRRFARAYGPYPLAFDEAVGKRYQELDLYLRQCHAERDLEALGAQVFANARERKAS